MPEDVENIDENEEPKEGEEEQPAQKNAFLENLKSILMVVLVVLAFATLIISNMMTASMAFSLGKRSMKQKIYEENGLVPEGKYRGPLFHLEEENYSVGYKDRPLFLQVDTFLVLENNRMLEEVREKTINIKNILVEIFTNHPLDEFKSRSGMQTARRMMLESINKILDKGRIKDVYFVRYRFVEKI